MKRLNRNHWYKIMLCVEFVKNDYRERLDNPETSENVKLACEQNIPILQEIIDYIKTK